jgi:hypothetical protein
MAKPTKSHLYSEVSFDEKSGKGPAPESLTLRFMQRFWRELTLTLALFGFREYLVLSMCVMSLYLYMVSSSWILILSMIVPSLLVMISVLLTSLGYILIKLGSLVYLAHRGLLQNFKVYGSYAPDQQQKPFERHVHSDSRLTGLFIPNKLFSVRRRTIVWPGVEANIRTAGAVPM